jgi:hypothetical protein
MVTNHTILQIAEHVVTFYKLTPDEIYELELVLKELRNKQS